MMKLARLPFVIMLFLTLCACSFQVSGIQNAYKSPNRASSEVATLSVSPNSTLVSIDGESTNSQSVTLTPGRHKIVLYSGKNNYFSNVNHMIVLEVNFKAGINYSVKVNKTTVWIVDSNNHTVSSIISKMDVTKSARL